MKKLILLSIGLLLSGALEAQIEKGDVQLGMALRFSRQDFVSNDINLNSYHPSAALFISKRTSVGLMLGYRSTMTSTIANSNRNETIRLSDRVYQLGFYSRYHVPINKKLYLYLQPSLLLGVGKSNQSPTISANLKTVNAYVAPGVSYFLGKQWAVDLSFSGLRYTRISDELAGVKQTNQRTDFNANFNNMDIGISFYIRQ